MDLYVQAGNSCVFTSLTSFVWFQLFVVHFWQFLPIFQVLHLKPKILLKQEKLHFESVTLHRVTPLLFIIHNFANSPFSLPYFLNLELCMKLCLPFSFKILNRYQIYNVYGSS